MQPFITYFHSNFLRSMYRNYTFTNLTAVVPNLFCLATQIKNRKIGRHSCHTNYDIVATGKLERQVRKASHCGSKQQQRSHAAIILCLFAFFTHFPFVVKRAFNTTPEERFATLCHIITCFTHHIRAIRFSLHNNFATNKRSFTALWLRISGVGTEVIGMSHRSLLVEGSTQLLQEHRSVSQLSNLMS